MRKSLSITELAKALAKAQGELENAKKDSLNPHYGSRYADIASIIDAIRAPLAKHGLSIIQGLDDAEKGVTVETLLLHESGEYLESSYTIPLSKFDAQGLGSAITYGRRYAISAMCRLASEDDDGNEASRTLESKPVAKPKTKIDEVREANKARILKMQQSVEQDGLREPEEVGTQQAQDAAPPFNHEAPPPAEKHLNAGNICQQFLLSETLAELVSIMNQWQGEASLHTQEERMEVNRVFAEAKKRLGKR